MSEEQQQGREKALPSQDTDNSFCVVDGWLVRRYADDDVVTVQSQDDANPEPQQPQYIILRIIPDPVDDKDDWYDLFVKDYSLKDQKEPASYDQQPPGLEKHYPYIKRLRVPGNVMLVVHEEMLR